MVKWYAKAIQTFKKLFMQYGYKQFNDDLPEVPAGSLNHEDQLTHDMKVTASDSSLSIPDQSQAAPSHVQVAANVEMAVEVPHNDSVVSDALTLSVRAKPLRDEPIAEITEMHAVAIESALNALSTVEQPSSPLSEVATLNLDPESQTTNAPENPLGHQMLQ